MSLRCVVCFGPTMPRGRILLYYSTWTAVLSFSVTHTLSHKQIKNCSFIVLVCPIMSFWPLNMYMNADIEKANLDFRKRGIVVATLKTPKIKQ